LVFQLQRQFRPEELYPSEGFDWTSVTDIGAYSLIPRLRDLPGRRISAIRVYAGHYPFFVHELLGDDLVTLTLLRDPVDRTVSLLKHLKRVDSRIHPEHGDRPIEAIYDDELFFKVFIENAQAKVFALTPHDDLRHAFPLAETLEYFRALERGDDVDRPDVTSTVGIDRQRLDLAQANLARVDVLGLTEDYDGFVDELRARFAWWPNARPAARANVNEDRSNAPASLRHRIAADNAYDIAFYEYARQLVADRSEP